MISNTVSPRVLFLEWRLLRTEGPALLIAALFLCLSGIAIQDGYVQLREQRIRVTASSADQAQLHQLRTKAAAHSKGGLKPAAAREGLLDFRAAIPLGPEAMLAKGQTGVLPHSYSYRKFNDDSPSIPTGGGRSLSNLFPAKNSLNPLKLLVGTLDLSFIVVYLYPLLVIALCYDTFSRDRELGTLSLALSQPVSFHQLLRPQLLLRGFLTFAFAIAIPSVSLALVWHLALGHTPLSQLGQWAMVSCAYVAVWFWGTVAISALCRDSMRAALSAIGAWVILVVLIPAVAAIAVDAVSGRDSVIEFVQTERKVRGDALAEANRTQSALRASFAELFAADGKPPEQMVELRQTSPLPVDVAHKQLRAFLANHPEYGTSHSLEQLLFFNQLAREFEIENRLRPVLLEGERKEADRSNLVGRFRWISPALATQNLLVEIAGTGSARHAMFLKSIDDYVRQRDAHFARLVARGQLMKSGDIGALPLFVHQPESSHSSLWVALQFGSALCLWLVLAALLAVHAIRRATPA